jgi:fibro-slime domain-containing protein
MRTLCFVVPALLAAAACTENDLGRFSDLDAPVADTGADFSFDEVCDPPAPEDTGAPGEDTGIPDDTTPEDPLANCVDGLTADYYNLPGDHPDVEGPVTGVVPGDLPWNHDWWDARYHAFTRTDTQLDFGNQWFPVDEGLPGDPFHFAVHWRAKLQVDHDGTARFELGSDDDGWAVIDGVVVADLGGIHGVSATTFEVPLTAGVHDLELFMAERHVSDAGFWFRFLDGHVRLWACP